MNFRQGLYQEAVYNSSKRNMDSSSNDSDQSTARSYKHARSKSLSQNEITFTPTTTRTQQPSLTRSISSRKLLSSDSVISDRITTTKAVIVKHASNKHNSSYLRLEDGRGKENRLSANSLRVKLSPENKIAKVVTPVKRLLTRNDSPNKSNDPPKLQVQANQFFSLNRHPSEFAFL